MAKKTRQLQWHKASKRWCKRYTDPSTGKKPLVYLGKGNPGPNNRGILDSAYDAALERWQAIEADLKASKEDQRRLDRLEELTVRERLADSPQRWATVRQQVTELEDGATVVAADHQARQRQQLSILAAQGHWAELARLAQALASNPDADGSRTVATKVDEFLAEKLVQARSGQRS